VLLTVSFIWQKVNSWRVGMPRTHSLLLYQLMTYRQTKREFHCTAA